MTNQNLSKEHKTTRNMLYIILSLTMILSFMVDFFTLINPKYRFLVNFVMLGIEIGNRAIAWAKVQLRPYYAKKAKERAK